MRLRIVIALLAVAAITVAALAFDDVEPQAEQVAAAPQSFSGVWYCPHGGGDGWNVELALTNPGSKPARVRIRTFSKDGAEQPRRFSVPARSDLRVHVNAGSRGAASEVEYFDGWVGASWIADAGGGQSGIAAEPCSKQLSRTWYLPDGTTLRGEDSWVVVMNPTAADAVFTVRLITEQQSIVTKDWTATMLKPGRSTAFHLNQKALARETVTAQIEVSIGRIAAASLGATKDGGVRAALGIPAGERSVTIPGGPDTGQSALVVGDTGPGRATYQGSLLRADGTQALGQLNGESIQPNQARTYDLATSPESAVVMKATGRGGLAVARRTFGTGGDAGSTAGGRPAAAWVVASGAPSGGDWRLVLANPGKTKASVSLWLISPGGLSEKLSPRVVNVGPGRSRSVGADFTEAARVGSVVAVASSGTFVPLAASFTSDGSGYSTAVGVPIPARWVPSDLGT